MGLRDWRGRVPGRARPRARREEPVGASFDPDSHRHLGRLSRIPFALTLKHSIARVARREDGRH